MAHIKAPLDHASKPNQVLNVGNHDLICETLEFYSGDLSENTVAQSDSMLHEVHLFMTVNFFYFEQVMKFLLKKHILHTQKTHFSKIFSKQFTK